MTMKESEIYEKVRDVLANSLAVEPELVTREARVTDDLGAESIDYLDIGFQMEKAFGIPIKLDEMLVGASPDERYVQNGKITDAGLEALRRRLPHLRLDRLQQDRDVRNFQSLLTVESLVQFVAVRLDGQGNAAPSPI
jgi:acyl carrier protein